jgi:signal transduction histidine kinase
LLILSITLFKENNINWYAVILVLLFIINCQVRIFLLKDSTLLSTISILSELLIIYFCFSDFKGVLFFYYLPALLDSAFLLKGKTSYIISAVAILSMLINGKALPAPELATLLASLIIFAVFSYYIKEEYAGKIKAQMLYDQLRLSEEKLKKANKDLELYANSIEELTLLRERNRISREIHDSVGHSLSTTIIQLGAIEKIAKHNGDTAASLASNLREFIKESLQEVRTAVRELKPREFEKYEGILALEELVKNFVKLTSVDVKLGFSNDKWDLNSDQSFVIYRVVQEFLSNSLRHGRATRVNIFLNFSKETLVITLQDNGIGCNDIKKGIGLTSIWERVKELGGSAEYNSKESEGFLLKVILIPIKAIEF